MASQDAAITQNMCIQYSDGECELKSGLIHLLPKFHGLAGEDSYHHLKEFHVVCSSMRPTTVTEEHIKCTTPSRSNQIIIINDHHIYTWNK